MVRSRVPGFIRSIVGLTLISDIGNISRVLITNRVGDNLGATIRKIYTVLAIGSITITVFMLFKVGTRVVISNSIAICVVSWGIISWFMVGISMVSGLVGKSRVRRLVSGCWVVNRSRLVSGCWVVNRSRLVGRSWVVDGSGLVGRSWVVDGRRFVGGSWVVDGSRLVGRSWVVDRSGLVGGGMGMVVTLGTGIVVTMGTGIVVTMGTGIVVTMGTSMVVTMGMGIVVTMGTGMVSVSGGMDRDVAGGMVGGFIFLLILVLVNLIGGSRGLTVHNCVRVSTGFVD